MKRLCLLFVMLLLAGCLMGCASAPTTSETSVSEPEVPVSEPYVPSPDAEILEDFTVQTIDGGSFSLSEALSYEKLLELVAAADQ